MSIYVIWYEQGDRQMNLGADERCNALRTHGEVQIVIVVGIELNSMGESKPTFFCIISAAGR